MDECECNLDYNCGRHEDEAAYWEQYALGSIRAGLTFSTREVR